MRSSFIKFEILVLRCFCILRERCSRLLPESSIILFMPAVKFSGFSISFISSESQSGMFSEFSFGISLKYLTKMFVSNALIFILRAFLFCQLTVFSSLISCISLFFSVLFKITLGGILALSSSVAGKLGERYEKSSLAVLRVKVKFMYSFFMLSGLS